VEYVQVKKLRTWKLAAFIVAFFSSFFVNASIWDDGTITLLPPTTQPTNLRCSSFSSEVCQFAHDDDQSFIVDYVLWKATQAGQYWDNEPYTYTSEVYNDLLNIEITQNFSHAYSVYQIRIYHEGSYSVGFNVTIYQYESESTACPPSGSPSFTSDYITESGLKCYDPTQLQAVLDDLSESQEDDNSCNRLVLDSGNNSADSMCYSHKAGLSCNVTKVDNGSYSYYKGTSSSPLGCAESDSPPYDASGIGSENDSCINSNGTNFCAANKYSHCSIIDTIEQCDAGCIELDGNFMCDAAQHPDVGEGDSNYFDDNGTCSVVAGSAYRGSCEDLGGVWEKEGDYTKTSCPASSISGTCSIATSGGCFSCLDTGGTWTPDPNAVLTNTEKGIQDVASLSQETNDTLRTIENTTRKGNESIISTLKTGNERLVGEIQTLTSTLSGTGTSTGGSSAGVVEAIEELKEKETYTTTTTDVDKSKFNAMFDASSVAQLHSEITALKAEVQSELSSIRSSAAALMTVTVPSATGYQSRNLTLTQGSFDLSLSRFQDFFVLLAGPVMLICSILAGFIILGGKD